MSRSWVWCTIPCAITCSLQRGGGGATLNGQPLRASDATDLGEAMVTMGYGKTPAVQRRFLDVVNALLGKVRKIRCFGAAAYDLCNLACGRSTAFYELGLRTWDIAAAAVILAESGVKMDFREYEPTRWNIASAAPGVFDAFQATIGEWEPGDE